MAGSAAAALVVLAAMAGRAGSEPPWVVVRSSFCVASAGCTDKTLTIFADGRVRLTGKGGNWDPGEPERIRAPLDRKAITALRVAIAKAKFSTLRRSYPAYPPAAPAPDVSVDDKSASTVLTIDGKTVDYEEDANRGRGTDELPTTAPKRLRELVDAIWRTVWKR